MGSIGVISGGLGFHEFINKYGIGRGQCTYSYLRNFVISSSIRISKLLFCLLLTCCCGLRLLFVNLYHVFIYFIQWGGGGGGGWTFNGQEAAGPGMDLTFLGFFW